MRPRQASAHQQVWCAAPVGALPCTHQRLAALCPNQNEWQHDAAQVAAAAASAASAARKRSTRTCTAAPTPSVRHPRSLHTAAKRRHTDVMSGSRYSYSGSARRGTGWWGVDRNTRPLMLCRVAAYCCRWLAGSLALLAPSCSCRHTSCTGAMDAAAAASDAQMVFCCPREGRREGAPGLHSCVGLCTAPLHLRALTA